jgi:hypothetical protein
LRGGKRANLDWSDLGGSHVRALHGRHLLRGGRNGGRAVRPGNLGSRR